MPRPQPQRSDGLGLSFSPILEVAPDFLCLPMGGFGDAREAVKVTGWPNVVVPEPAFCFSFFAKAVSFETPPPARLPLNVTLFSAWARPAARADAPIHAAAITVRVFMVSSSFVSNKCPARVWSDGQTARGAASTIQSRVDPEKDLCLRTTPGCHLVKSEIANTLAVIRLMMSSNFIGCRIGRLTGFFSLANPQHNLDLSAKAVLFHHLVGAGERLVLDNQSEPRAGLPRLSTSPADRGVSGCARRAASNPCRPPSTMARGRRWCSTDLGPSIRHSDRQCAHRDPWRRS